MKIVKASCIVIFITGLLAGVFFSSSVSAQDISGTWHGKLSIPTGSLTIVFHISQTEQGAYVTTLDSPDQGANGIKTQTTSFNDSTLIIQIPVIHASYKGKLNSDNTINGTFTQGMPLPLNLKKGEASRPKRPQEPQPPFPYMMATNSPCFTSILTLFNAQVSTSSVLKIFCKLMVLIITVWF